MTDERKKLPSASGLERLKLCRGSYNLESKFKEIEVSEVAETGTLIHDCLAGVVDPIVLNESDLWTYEKCREYEEEMVRKFFDFQPDRIKAAVRHSEQRLYLHDESNELATSGQVDVMYIDKETGACLVIDYKTGWKAVTDPAKNMQLRAYAVLAWKNYGVKSVRVGVVQPNCRPITADCDYTEEDLQKAYQQVLRILREAKEPDAPLTPGAKQCEYCKAKSFCPALAEHALSQTDQFKRAVEIILVSGAEMDQREQLLPSNELADLLDNIGVLTKWADSLKGEAKLRIRSGREVKGYGLVEPAAKREVKKPYELYERMKEFINPKEILETAKFGIGALEGIFTGKLGKKKTEAKQILKDLFPDEIGIGEPGERQLKRVVED